MTNSNQKSSIYGSTFSPMLSLRLTQSAINAQSYRVDASLEGHDSAAMAATAEFDFVFTPQDREDIRWYLEDYLQHAADPAPKIAARIESRIAELGTELFQKLFLSNNDARAVWTTVRDRLTDTRFEIVTGASQTTALPWELLRDSEDKTLIALRSSAFVRAPDQIRKSQQSLQSYSGPIRILLVICRPGGSDDVPFRSVASRLIRGLDESAREAFQLDVLRPPNFKRLKEVLNEARDMGAPYHVVHFDGHGVYFDPFADGSRTTAPRGYLLFENEALQNNTEYIHGTLIGKLLTAANVPLLVINACRSAHEEPPATPVSTHSVETADRSNINSPEPLTKTAPFERRGFGSLAQEAVNAGVPGVVAMRYNVYAVTAAQFVADLYSSLASGQSLGEAVSSGRQFLHARPQREIAYQPRPLQDWIVPIVFEAAPLTLFPHTAEKSNLKISAGETATVLSSQFPPELNRRPKVGFFGRDETLLAIDRAFDSHSVVLMHAFAGSGKTSTAAEFARWYKLTGGIKGPVLFTSFEHYQSPAQLLNETIGNQFDNYLKRSGTNWLALTVERRREVALQVLTEVPVLWIWDNVESVAGFPAKADSAWTDAEQQDLINFLRDAQRTKAKFLLTSRRKERDWLNDLPKLVAVPPMLMEERVQFARALAGKQHRSFDDVEDWMPLLSFTAGNPLTITVLVNQALREGLKTKTEIESFVTALRTGETLIEDDERTEGRDSLRVALSYGFQRAFTTAEQKQIALLHFFEGIVQASMLGTMGTPETEWCLDEVRGLTREQRIELLDRCADLGFLTALGRGVYSIHPALPQYLNSLFCKHYDQSREKATRAFAGALGWFGHMTADAFLEGQTSAMDWIQIHYFNFIKARKIATETQQWKSAISCMRALRFYFSERPTEWPEWKKLVYELVPYFFQSGSDEPIPEHQEHWMFVMEFRVEIARNEGNLDEARRLQKLSLYYSRELVRNLVQNPTASKDDKTAVRNFANDLVVGAQIQPTPEKIIEYLQEALKLYEGMDDELGIMGVGRCAEGLSDTYRKMDNFAEAERWCEYGLRRLRGAAGGWAGLFFGLLGRIHYEHFQYEAALTREKGDDPAEDVSRSYLPKARQALESALILLPPFKLDVRARTHALLGNTFTHLYLYEQAFAHFLQAINDFEAMNEVEGAMVTRLELAVMLVNADRFADAMQYAEAVYNYAHQNPDWTYSEEEILQIVKIIQDRMKESK